MKLPDPPTAWLDVELARLSASLHVASGHDPDPSDLPLHEGCERLHAILLSRRIRHELDWPVAESAPEALWAHRFHLTRLQAPGNGNRSGDWTRRIPRTPRCGSAADWIDKLDRRRDELAKAAESKWHRYPSADRVAPGERVVQSALDEAGETMAFLEDISLRSRGRSAQADR